MFGWLFGKRERKIRDELDYHLAMLAREPGAQPQRRLGNRTRIEEELRGLSRWSIFDRFRRNASYAARILRRNPAFSLTAILTIALGICSVVLLFGILDAVLLRPLSYRDPSRIVFLWESKKQLSGQRVTVAPANYRSWRESSRSFEAMALIEGERFPIPLDAQVAAGRTIRGLSVSPGFFSLLGITPQLGRAPASPEEIALSDSFWRREFHSNPGILGQPVSLGGRTFVITGILPRDFYFPGFGADWEVWTTLHLTASEESNRDNHCCGAIARLRPRVTLSEAQREMNEIAARLEREFPQTNRGARLTLVPASEQVSAGSRRAVGLLMASAGILLWITCANVAILLLLRAAARSKETALRLALGASRLDLFLQWITESLALGLLGGALGLAAAVSAFPLVAALPIDLPRIHQVSLDSRVLFFSLAITLACSVLFGLAPAVMRPTRPRFTLHSFVVAQLALAFLLVAATGLLFRSLQEVLAVDAGFRPEHLLTATLTFPPLSGGTSRAKLETSLLAGIRRLPGVISAAWTTNLPIGGPGWQIYFSIRRRPMLPGEVLTSAQRLVSPEYFETMGTRLLAGRTFTTDDKPGTIPAAVINDAFARRYFPGRNPLGQQVKWGRADDSRYPVWFTIAGVVEGVRDRSLENAPTPELYMCLSQMDREIGEVPGTLSLAVRHSAGAGPLARAIRSAATGANPQIVVSSIQTMDNILSGSLRGRKFHLTVLSVFAGLALLLSSIGIYGVVGYSFALRTREIGIRIALGASRRSIQLLVLRKACFLAFSGATLGLGSSLLLGRLLRSFLFRANPLSPAILVSSGAALIVVALLAAARPARRMAALDPSRALRSE